MESPVRLCGIDKKNIGSIFNLQELPVESAKTAKDELSQGQKGNGCGKEALVPVSAVAAENAGNIVFINGGSMLQNRLDRRSVFRIQDDLHLVQEGDLGIGDDESWKEGMCPGADRAFEAADRKTDSPRSLFERPEIVAMYGETAGVAAGTGELVELQGGNEGIV